ncbi:hypothetical protein MKK58_12810 [Methylobacterium sp. J-078]|uniref:hypothetical protein n=1 Tax=Methylobacterium sp. J-078 TaxID=2836657 RepID=UPI001FBACDC4|nr:hypothetical protein [Methylobacterium sp. J-078]MCJ2045401.1 hypothetical protein [Methylobacterium sp. J-078]
MRDASAILGQGLDGPDPVLEIADPLQLVSAGIFALRLGFSNQPVLLGPQAFDERFQV